MNNAVHPGGFPGGGAASDNNAVVARYRNGQVVKGHTRDFFPDRPSFHILPMGGQTTVPVKTAELKGVFFVHDLLGNRLLTKGRRFPAVDEGPQTGRRIAVLFEDGELLVGYAQIYNPEKPGFFVFPADTRGNNIRVYVLRAATREVKLGPAADELARTAPPPRQKPRPAA